MRAAKNSFILSTLAVIAALSTWSGAANADDPANGIYCAAPAPLATLTAVAACVRAFGVRADDGARVTACSLVPGLPRAIDLTIHSPGLTGQPSDPARPDFVGVRVLLPASYGSSPALLYPTLYLLHGARLFVPAGSGPNFQSWTDHTCVDELTANVDVLTVMPEGGDMGGYSDWDNGGKGGTPTWETFHTVELPQLVGRAFRANDVRAVAGLSMGGFGAFSYAARHPGMFRAAASFSGMLRTSDFFDQLVIIPVDLFLGVNPYGIWGATRAQWAAHEPYALAPVLELLPTYIASGDGNVTSIDRTASLGNELAEALASGQAHAMVTRMQHDGAHRLTAHFYRGTHSPPYWNHELRCALPTLIPALGAYLPSLSVIQHDPTCSGEVAP